MSKEGRTLEQILQHQLDGAHRFGTAVDEGERLHSLLLTFEQLPFESLALPSQLSLVRFVLPHRPFQTVNLVVQTTNLRLQTRHFRLEKAIPILRQAQFAFRDLK